MTLATCMYSHDKSPNVANSGNNGTGGHPMAVSTTFTAIDARYTFHKRKLGHFLFTADFISLHTLPASTRYPSPSGSVSILDFFDPPWALIN